MPDKAFITPKVLKWARETARMSVETASLKIPVSIVKLVEWEEGISQPTIRQAQTLAKAYKRPFALLFLPDIPYDFTPLQDFRSKNAKPLSTSSVFIIRELQQKQLWIKELYEENREQKLPFVGKYTIQDDPITVAKDILNQLKINPLNYTTENPIKEWIEKAEKNGICVSRTSFINSHLVLDSNELQGFAIADEYAPFVFVNSEDWNAPQLFTLVHELAHIWIKETGISNEIESELVLKHSLHPVELFCNEVAANALLPIDIITNINSQLLNSSQDIFKLSKSFGVSSFAFLYRIFKLKLITIDSYRKLKSAADDNFNSFLKREEIKKSKQKEKKSGPSYYLLQLNKNSRLFTQVVIDAFRNGSVEANQASLLLNTKVTKFSNLEAQMYK